MSVIKTMENTPIPTQYPPKTQCNAMGHGKAEIMAPKMHAKWQLIEAVNFNWWQRAESAKTKYCTVESRLLLLPFPTIVQYIMSPWSLCKNLPL
jgi:hypothetical protein